MRRCLSLFLLSGLFGCTLPWEQKTGTAVPASPQVQGNDSSGGLLIFPSSEYTTEKGRYLGERYNRNLDDILGKIVQDRSTRALQFAPTSFSIKSIGFFRHPASKFPDERYLEVILGVPEVFDEKTDFSAKLDRLFGQYGPALLAILSGDPNILNDKQVAGYGLNFSWRTTGGSRVTLERGVVYVGKEEARKFLTAEIDRQTLLGKAVIFALQGGTAPQQTQYAAPAKPFAPPAEKAAAALKVDRPEIQQAGVRPGTVMKEEEIKPSQTPPVEKAASSIPPASPPVEKSQESKVAKAQVEKEAPDSKNPPKTQRLQGFIVQLAFDTQTDADHWSNLLKGKGRATPMSFADDEGAVRLRVGNFKSFFQAERLIKRLRQETLEGLVLYIPK